MSALRYSGEVKIRVTWIDTPGKNMDRHGGHYRCTLMRSRSERREKVTIYVGAPCFLEHSLDACEAFDATASAALSFASEPDTDEGETWDGSTWSDGAAFKADGSGWHIGRSLAQAWPAEPQKAGDTVSLAQFIHGDK